VTPFDDFLATGAFPPLRVGGSQEEIRRALAAPHDVGNPKVVRWPNEIWTYNGHFLQIYFRAKRVTGYALYFVYPAHLPPQFNVAELPFTSGSTATEVSAYLEERGILHRTEGNAADRIVVAGAVDVIFFDDGRLDRIVTR
jgi:hypothetical protein